MARDDIDEGVSAAVRQTGADITCHAVVGAVLTPVVRVAGITLIAVLDGITLSSRELDESVLRQPACQRRESLVHSRSDGNKSNGSRDGGWLHCGQCPVLLFLLER